MQHWDSKILKLLEHAAKKQEVLAIRSKTSNIKKQENLHVNIKKQENLLSIVQLEREGNTKNETQRILQVLDELGISRIFIIVQGLTPHLWALGCVME